MTQRQRVRGQVLNEADNKWREADFWIWVASADRGGSGPFDAEAEAEYCWCVRSRDGKHVQSDKKSVLQARVNDYHTAALVPATRAALGCVPKGSKVHVFSDVQFFTDILNEEPTVRVESGYLRRNRKPLAYQDEWKALDRVTAERSLRVSAGLPPKSDTLSSLEWNLSRELGVVKEGASKAARNIGLRLKDWDL
jgi:hypothetical protein